MQAPEVRNWWNIRLAGKTKSIPENNTMWNVLTTASATPILELDFLGADAHELLGFSDHAKFAALQSGETLHSNDLHCIDVVSHLAINAPLVIYRLQPSTQPCI